MGNICVRNVSHSRSGLTNIYPLTGTSNMLQRRLRKGNRKNAGIKIPRSSTLTEVIIKKRFSTIFEFQSRAITLALNEKPVRTPCYSQKSSTGSCVVGKDVRKTNI